MNKFDAFKIFRVLGFLPYKNFRSSPTYCRKWHLFSYIIALFIISVSTFRAYLYTKFVVGSSYAGCIFSVLLKYEPMFLTVNLCVIYQTLFPKKKVIKTITLIKKLHTLRSKLTENSRKENRIVFRTFGCLLTLFILIFVYHYVNLQLDPNAPFIYLWDFLVAYIFTALCVIQLL